MGDVPQDRSEPDPGAEGPESAPSLAPTRRALVWVLDDSPLEREAARRALSSMCAVELFEDAASLLEGLSGGGDPDVLLLDWHLPGMTGVELLRFVRQSRNELSLPALMLTGTRAAESDLVEALDAGANDYVTKPYGTAELRGRVRTLAHLRVLYERSRQAERAARESERRAAESAEQTRQILASLAEGVILQDRDGVLRDANPSASTILGRTREDLEGRTSHQPQWEAVRPDGSPMPGEEHAPMRALATGAPQTGGVMGLRRPDGSLLWLQLNAQPLRHAATGAVTGVVTSFLDVTERRRLEAEAEARAAFEQHLIGIVSHDLRTPIMTIALGATVLEQQGVGEAQARVVARIASAAGRATRMTSDLLDFTRARLGGGLPVEPRPMELHDLAQRVAGEARLAHPTRQVDVGRSGEGGGVWDPDRVEQVLTNLLNNALRYSSPATPVRVETRGEADGVVLEVRNEGPPIPPELLARIFAPMQRGSSRGNTGGQGVGLGLYIVDQVARAHGGTVDVRSTEGGTTFTVRLPRVAPGAVH